jgi:hypothetical protein
VDLVLGARAGTHELAALSEATPHRPGPFVRHPDRVELAGGQQPGQRARVQTVGLGAGPADAGVVRTDHDDPRDIRLQDSRDLRRVARDL